MGFLTRFLGKTVMWVIGFIAAVGLAATVALTLFALTLLPDLPPVDSLDDIELKVPLRVFASDGSLIAEYGEERRVPVRIDQVPKELVQAILAAEDNGFYDHPGVDISGVIRAVMANLKSGGASQGASTITMQVARNYFLTRKKTYTRKLKEVLLALRLERALTKDQILELYMNKIFLGHRSYGFAAAAKVYYDKDLNELSLPQISMLAGLPKAPSRSNPISNPKRAKIRRNYVLDRMHGSGWITDEQYQEARESGLTAKKYVAKVDFDSPYVAEMARQYVIERFGESAYEAGYNVYTSIVPEYQQAADRAVRDGIMAYEYRHGWRGPVAKVDLSTIADQEALLKVLSEQRSSHEILPGIVMDVTDNSALVLVDNGESIELPLAGMQWARRFKTTRRKGPKPKKVGDVLDVGMVIHVRPTHKGPWELTQLPTASAALVALNPDNGAIRAITGGFDYYLSKFNRATQAERQPGSNIKPFIYSAAIDKGFTAASLVSGAPITIQDPEMENIWRPENYSGKFFGPTRIRKALSLSLNLVSVRLLRAIGPEYARVYLERFGFDRDSLPRGLSLSLGSASVTPLTLASAYAVLANGGYRVEPYLITRIEDRTGTIIEEVNPFTVCRNCPEAEFELTELPDQIKAEETVEQTDDGSRSVISGLLAPSAPGDAKRDAPRVLDKRTAFIMQSLLREVVNSGTAQRAKALGRSDLAGKTGTTNNFNDAWFSGFSPQMHATVWFGFDKPSDLGKSEAGSRAALPIWVDFMRGALTDFPEQPQPIPDGIVTSYVSKETGKAAVPGDPGGYKEYFVAGTEPASGDYGGNQRSFGTTALPSTGLPRSGTGVDGTLPGPTPTQPAGSGDSESLF